jgi:hypothetical protein
MNIPKVSSSVRRITLLQTDASGTKPVVLYQRGGSRKKKRGTQPFRYLDRVTRRIAEAQAKSAQSYLSRHEKSNEKRDGWVRDLPVNVARASQKGVKALQLPRLLTLD